MEYACSSEDNHKATNDDAHALQPQAEATMLEELQHTLSGNLLLLLLAVAWLF